MPKPPELDARFLRGERPAGRFEEAALPPARAPLTVIVPTNFRWTTPAGECGPLPLLLHDLALALRRELPGVEGHVFIFDDTALPDRVAIAAAVTAALDGIAEPPPVYLVGAPERDALLAALDAALPGDVDREVLRFLTTHWGYGPQRVRGDTAVSGSPVVLSLDDDLRAKEVIQARPAWLEAQGLEQVTNSLVYAPRPAFDDPSLFEVVPSEQLRPYLRLLGKTPEEAGREWPGLPFSVSTRNTKDWGLEQSMAGAFRPAQYVTTHDGSAYAPQPGDFIGVATGRKRSVPDVNAGRMLDHYVATGLETGGSLRVRAIPSGPQTAFVTARDTNPDCAVMARALDRPSVAKIPWLLSDPAISRRCGLADGPYRAEDRLFTRPPSAGVLLAGVPAIFKHARAETGYRPDALPCFWSELLGDTLGDAVLQNLVDDPLRHRFSLGQAGGFSLEREVTKKILDLARAKAKAIDERIRALEQDEGAGPAHAREVFVASLSRLRTDLEEQCGPDAESFHRRVDEEISAQFDFVRRTLAVYYTLMEACRDLRSSGRYPAAVFRAPR